jgi:hypothetical protein
MGGRRFGLEKLLNRDRCHSRRVAVACVRTKVRVSAETGRSFGLLATYWRTSRLCHAGFPVCGVSQVVNRDGKVWQYVNGKLANEGTDAFPASGKILFQSEGAEVFFRNIKIYPLK